MNADLERRIALIASDRESGASEILTEALSILQTALAGSRAEVVATARALCRAQPGMGSLWNAALAAIAGVEDPAVFDRFSQRAARGPEALGRFALSCLAPDETDRAMDRATTDRGAPLRIVTISFSRSVVAVLDALAQARPLRVSCSEGRPALEGRRLAARMAGAGVPVSCFSDAALGHAVGAADAVVVGADAVTPEWFLNKSGTRMLVATAAQQGTPVYVVASRDKFVSHEIGAVLHSRDRDPAEIWKGAPAGVIVRNPYFEPTPLDLITSLISDVGVLGAAHVPELCQSFAAEVPAMVIAQLGLIN